MRKYCGSFIGIYYVRLVFLISGMDSDERIREKFEYDTAKWKFSSIVARGNMFFHFMSFESSTSTTYYEFKTL